MATQILEPVMRTIGWILSVLLALSVINGAYFFLRVLKVSFQGWVFLNACAPAIITFLAGFVAWLVWKNRILLPVSTLPLFFFGTLGLFVFPWEGMNVIPQASHILMTLAMVWVLVNTFRFDDWKNAAIGLLIGILIFAPFIGFQQNYVRMHPEQFQRMIDAGKPRQ